MASDDRAGSRDSAAPEFPAAWVRVAAVATLKFRFVYRLEVPMEVERMGRLSVVNLRLEECLARILSRWHLLRPHEQVLYALAWPTPARRIEEIPLLGLEIYGADVRAVPEIAAPGIIWDGACPHPGCEYVSAA